MHIKKKLLLFTFVLLGYLTQAQSKKLWIELADNAYAKKDYATAANYYSKVLDDTTVLRSYVLPYEAQLVNLKMKSLFEVPELRVTKRKDSINTAKEDLVISSKYDFILYRLAQSYRLNFDYKHAAEQYKKVVERNVYPDAGFYYGLSLMSIKSYSSALKAFEAYVQSKQGTDSLRKVAQKKEASCYFALDSLQPRKVQRVKMLDTVFINKGTSNFAPMYYLSNTKMIFTSARRGGVVTDPEKQDSRYFCDLYYSELEDTIWQRPVNFGRPVNTSLHEGAGVFTPDEVMLFTRWSDNNRTEAFIYMARTNGGRFYEAMKLGTNINVPGYKTQQPCVSFDGTKLFFSSNRPGGQGGFDLWMASIDGNGFIGNATNLGPNVNSSGDEITPFFHDVSSTLYFSSNSWPGLGGYDVFKSSLNVDDSIYAKPVNLNAPLNSAKDDAYYVMDRLGTKGLFSSDRLDCPGGHCYNIYDFVNGVIKFDIEGIVYDEETNDPIPSALVTIRDVHGGDEPFFIVTDEKGHYQSELKPNMEYFIKAQKNGYFGKAASAITRGLTETTHFVEDFPLSKIPAGDIEIEGIEYDFDKATLRPKSLEILDKIVDLLKINDNLTIELSSHTDSRGNDAYNMRLSQARAQSCVDYLLLKGIPKTRVIANGYGETKPIVSQAEIDKMIDKSPEFEAAHQKNRRTAFRVIGEAKINIINLTK